MNFNYSSEKKEFDKMWARLENEYREAGMPEENIKEMRDFDFNYFKLKRNTILHTYDFPVCEESDVDDNNAFALFEFWKIENALAQELDKAEAHSKYWWIEELESDELISKIKRLSKTELEIVTLYAFEEKTEKEIGAMLGLTQKSVSRRICKIKRRLTE